MANVIELAADDPARTREFWAAKAMTIKKIRIELALRKIPMPMAWNGKPYANRKTDTLINAIMRIIEGVPPPPKKKYEDSRKCVVCGKGASFRERHVGGKMTHCKPCGKKLGLDLVNPYAPKCEAILDNGTRCTKDANCRIDGELIKRWCAGHGKLRELKPVTVKYCNFIMPETGEECGVGAGFGYGGRKSAERCATHKGDRHNVTNMAKCAFPGCTAKQPKFYSEATHEWYCGTHGKGLPNKRSSKCKAPTPTGPCQIQKVFGFVKNKALACEEHGTPQGMHNVMVKTCGDLNDTECKTHPTFILEGGKPQWCEDHAPGDAYTIGKCKFPRCEHQVKYGIPGHSISRCFAHHTRDMMLRPRTRCAKFQECGLWAQWGSGRILKHCEKHAAKGEINLVEAICKGKCKMVCVPNEEGLCEYCEPRAFSAGRLAKQNALMVYLDSQGLQGDSTDRQIEGGCDKYRPDRIFMMPKLAIVLECDEHQHRNYADECEFNRMYNIAQSGFGGIPVMFIRWNPDEYKAGDDSAEEPVAKRHMFAAEFIKGVLAGEYELAEAFTYSIKLYYDGWGGLDAQPWEIITPWDAVNVGPH